MEYPEEQYYRLNRILLSAIGLWPYDNSSIKQIKVILLLLILFSCIIAQLMKLFISIYDTDLMKALSFDFLVMQWTFKYITFNAAMKNIKKLRKRVRSNWSILEDIHEIEIIQKYSNTGRLFTVFITMYTYFGCFIIILVQYIPNLLDIIMPLNESRPRKHLITAEYFIDQQKYFYILTIYINLVLFAITTTGVATETFSLANALHAFGMFKIASYRMERVLIENERMHMTKKYVMYHDRIIAAVDIHRRAIKFSELLKASFGVPYLFLFVISECLASITFFNLFRIITIKQEILELIICILLIVFHFLFVTFGNFAGQEFINCERNIYRIICDTQWYNAPLKTQKLILFLIQKTTKDYQLDAGGMFNPSLEGFASGLSMLFSFFMVLCSVQR